LQDLNFKEGQKLIAISQLHCFANHAPFREE